MLVFIIKIKIKGRWSVPILNYIPFDVNKPINKILSIILNPII